MSNEGINFENEHGELRTILATNEDEMETISSNMSYNSDVDEDKLDRLIEYFDEKKLKVGFISSLKVSEESRGLGVGRSFMETFKNEIASKADVCVLLARTENIQADGFDLEKFYESYGFKGVLLEYGDMLMVNNGYEKEIDDVLNLKEERKNILKFFEENGCDEKHLNLRSFLIKKESEIKETLNPEEIKTKRKSKRRNNIKI